MRQNDRFCRIFWQKKGVKKIKQKAILSWDAFLPVTARITGFSFFIKVNAWQNFLKLESMPLTNFTRKIENLIMMRKKNEILKIEMESNGRYVFSNQTHKKASKINQDLVSLVFIQMLLIEGKNR